MNDLINEIANNMANMIPDSENNDRATNIVKILANNIIKRQLTI